MTTPLARFLLAPAAGLALAGAAAAQDDYPSRSLTYIVPFGAGGQTDLASRVLADAMADELGVAVQVVNRSGAGGTVGSAEVAAAEPDGYTVGTTTSSPMIQAPNRTNTPYDLDSFAFICRVYSNPMIMVVKADSDYDSIDGIVEAAKGGERVTFGTVGTGSVQHVAMVELMNEAGFEATQVQAAADADNVRNILADVVDTYWVAGSVYSQNADLLKPIAVFGPDRLELLPDTPTSFEEGYDVAAGVWGAMVAPADIPEDRLATLRDACEAAQATDAFKETLTGFAMEPVYMGGPETEDLARAQFESAGEVLEELGLVEK